MNFKKLREAKELSQLEVATEVGCNVQQISQIERGTIPVPLCHVSMLAKTLGIGEADLMKHVIEVKTKKLIEKQKRYK